MKIINKSWVISPNIIITTCFCYPLLFPYYILYIYTIYNPLLFTLCSLFSSSLSLSLSMKEEAPWTYLRQATLSQWHLHSTPTKPPLLAPLEVLVPVLYHLLSVSLGTIPLLAPSSPPSSPPPIITPPPPPPSEPGPLTEELSSGGSFPGNPLPLLLPWRQIPAVRWAPPTRDNNINSRLVRVIMRWGITIRIRSWGIAALQLVSSPISWWIITVSCSLNVSSPPLFALSILFLSFRFNESISGRFEWTWCMRYVRSIGAHAVMTCMMVWQIVTWRWFVYGVHRVHTFIISHWFVF